MSKPWRAIVVDDNPRFLRSGVRLLGSIDHVVVVGEASSGEGAVRAVATLRPDLVLMDLTMPGVDGIAATRRIASEKDPPLIIINTFLYMLEYRDDAVAAGACGFLNKARLAETLPALIRSLRLEFVRHADRESTREPAHGSPEAGPPDS
ncbi:MAG: response regulator transcription factor [Isosphaeraceae bacterium]